MFDALSLLRAIGRRWLLALILGIVFGSAAAAVAWKFIPMPYTTFALIRISVQRQRLLYKTEDSRFDRPTQSALLRTPIVLSNALNRPEVAAIPQIQELPDPLDWLQRQLSRGITFPGGELMRVEMSGENPTTLAPIVNSVVDSFMSEIADSEQTTRLTRISDLEKVRAQTEQIVQSKQANLRGLAEQIGTAETDTAAIKHQTMEHHYSSLLGELTKVEFQRARTEVKVRTAQTKAESQEYEVSEKLVVNLLAREPVVREQEARIAKLQQDLAEYELRSADKTNAAVERKRKSVELAKAALESRREELRPQIEDELRKLAESNKNIEVVALENELVMLKEQTRDLKKEVDRQKEELDRMGQDSVELSFMRKEMEQSESVHNKALTELTALKIEIQAPDRAVVVTRAATPKVRNTTRRDQGTLIAGAGGFGLTVLLVGFIEWRARRITSPVDISRNLGMRVVGTVPALPSRKRVAPMTNGHLSKGARRWYRVFEESFDVLRATLLYGNEGSSPRTLMVTSAHGREGKSTLSSHVAASLARAGRSTLLIDGDFRRPSLHTLFGVARQPGLSDVVMGTVEIGKAIQPTVVPNLFLLTAGVHTPNVSDLTTSKSLKELLNGLSSQWDNVVLDAPPILPVSDGLIFGQCVDGVVLTALSGVTGALALQDAQDRLQSVGIKILGCVLMGFEPSSYYGYYVTPYYHRYADHYADPADEPNEITDKQGMIEKK